MIHFCAKHKKELVLCQITQGENLLGYLWICSEEECDEVVEPTKEEIDEYGK